MLATAASTRMLKSRQARRGWWAKISSISFGPAPSEQVPQAFAQIIVMAQCRKIAQRPGVAGMPSCAMRSGLATMILALWPKARMVRLESVSRRRRMRRGDVDALADDVDPPIADDQLNAQLRVQLQEARQLLAERM